VKIAWATDLHLNFVDEEVAAALCDRIAATESDRVLIGGDTAEAHDVSVWLTFLADHLEPPIAFVLGNHDYYGGALASVRTEMRTLSSDTLTWLPAAGVVELAPALGLVGHGGWGDAGYGDFAGSDIIMSDYVVIDDLRHVGQPTQEMADHLGGWTNKGALKTKLVELGRDAARTLRPHLREALERYPEVLVLTHVPPFAEACWHKGRISDPDWLPSFACKAVGDLLRELVPSFPDRRVTVLTGHTHGSGEARILPNLRVLTQGAEYGKPDFQVLEIGEK